MNSDTEIIFDTLISWLQLLNSSVEQHSKVNCFSQNMNSFCACFLDFRRGKRQTKTILCFTILTIFVSWLGNWCLLQKHSFNNAYQVQYWWTVDFRPVCVLCWILDKFEMIFVVSWNIYNTSLITSCGLLLANLVLQFLI